MMLIVVTFANVGFILQIFVAAAVAGIDAVDRARAIRSSSSTRIARLHRRRLLGAPSGLRRSSYSKGRKSSLPTLRGTTRRSPVAKNLVRRDMDSSPIPW
eukprot:CAMPEP_0197174620 /NCGR_PEP_ID=MMETSP1423-20130617/1056_1 /TAXON_ID=476441 /ORGANISM="Pseudo-nitzschia heimii, Strain UNC1101" /LENGTH=99 /DNA_ID=CAMNT_0042623563 /DNA_START=523 /DNA_END=819 /DNA_ORIENTATION=+